MEKAAARWAMVPSMRLRHLGAAGEVVAWSTRVVSPLQDCFPAVAEALAVASARLVLCCFLVLCPGYVFASPWFVLHSVALFRCTLPWIALLCSA